jgi:hypothetical protein
MSQPMRVAALLATVTLTGGEPPPRPTIEYTERLFGMSFEDP